MTMMIVTRVQVSTASGLLIYRITGLWVALAGIGSWWLATNGDEELQRSACLLLTGVHVIESLLKLHANGLTSPVFLNAHFVPLLLLAARS